MTEEQVIKLIGEENWDKFLNWMSGQTVGMYPDGSFNYYECDVEAFCEKLRSGYDRQKDPHAWD